MISQIIHVSRTPDPELQRALESLGLVGIVLDMKESDVLVVRVELHSARTGRVSTLGLLRIVNDGTGSTERGNYLVELAHRSSGRCSRRSAVLGHARRRVSVWKLVSKALTALGHGPKEVA